MAGSAPATSQVCDEQGFFKIVDRKKDMILVSGFSVYPNEIEDVVALHPKGAGSGRRRRAEPVSGELVKIFVVRKMRRLQRTR